MKNIIPVQDLNSPELCFYTKHSETELMRYYEPDPGLFIAESPKVIERALHAGYVPISMLLEPRHLNGEAKELLTELGDIPIYTASSEQLKQLTGYALTRGALCAMQRKPFPTVSAICKNAKRIAILEHVVNPTNIGAIFRSAAALNIDAVLLTPGCCDPLYRRAIRVSMGTVFQIPWCYFDGIESTWQMQGLPLLREMGFRTVALALCDDSVDIDDPELNAEEKLAILLGAEGDGLTQKTITHCDYTVRIPMSHGVDSLNVAAASAIAFWQLAFQPSRR